MVDHSALLPAKNCNEVGVGATPILSYFLYRTNCLISLVFVWTNRAYAIYLDEVRLEEEDLMFHGGL